MSSNQIVYHMYMCNIMIGIGQLKVLSCAKNQMSNHQMTGTFLSANTGDSTNVYWVEISSCCLSSPGYLAFWVGQLDRFTRDAIIIQPNWLPRDQLGYNLNDMSGHSSP